VLIIIHFGRNPKNGGSPPRLNITIITRENIVILIRETEKDSLPSIEFLFIKRLIKPIVIVIYTEKYRVNVLNEHWVVIKIHLIWPMDEYARRARSCDWSIPPTPPIIALNITTTNKMNGVSRGANIIINNIGLIFCHVARIKHINHEILDMTWGNHWWHGAIPSFTVILIINITIIIGEKEEFVNGLVDIIPAVNINPLPTAWIIKYLTLASVSCKIWELATSGIKERRFNSIPIHKYNQFVLDRVIKVPIIVVDINKKNEGVIKLWKELNLSDEKLEAYIWPHIVYFHSKEPSFHSWYKPKIKIIQNPMIISLTAVDRNLIDGIGINKAISISNTRNRTARIKNRKENGIRAELWGSKPHSNGVDFSKFTFIFLFNKNVAIIMAIGKIAAMHIAKVIDIIFPGDFGLCLWSKNSLLLQASRKDAGGETSCLTSSKLSVRPAQHHTTKKETIIITTKVIGKNCFHVRLISLS